jgi:AraC-like DNA-binding protein
MVKSKNKIGFSEIGGIYIGKNIKSVFHKHPSVAIILSFSEEFEIITPDNKSFFYEAALIPMNIDYKLISNKNDFTVFIHLDPYSETSLIFKQPYPTIQGLNKLDFVDTLNDLKKWFDGIDSSPQKVVNLLEIIVSKLPSTYLRIKKMDERILRAIHFMKNSESENINLKHIADIISLSPSRFYHLFKQETGLTFRQYVLHCKMVNSLHAIHNHHNLTHASHFGGFSDQSHFIKTFKKTFGIKPSSIKK